MDVGKAAVFIIQTTASSEFGVKYIHIYAILELECQPKVNSW